MNADETRVPKGGDQADGTGKTSAALVLGHSSFDGSSGRGWTERSEGSHWVSGWHPPTPATHQFIADRALRGFRAETVLPEGSRPMALDLSATRISRSALAPGFPRSFE